MRLGKLRAVLLEIEQQLRNRLWRTVRGVALTGAQRDAKQRRDRRLIEAEPLERGAVGFGGH